MVSFLLSGLFPFVLTPPDPVADSPLFGFLITVALNMPEIVSTYGGITKNR